MTLKFINITILSIFIILLVGCEGQVTVDEGKVENLQLLFIEYRNHLTNFNYEEMDELYSEINLLLEDKAFKEDRIVLQGYLESLYRVKEVGVEPYQQFLKDLPKTYDGILSEVLWNDYQQLYNQ